MTRSSAGKCTLICHSQLVRSSRSSLFSLCRMTDSPVYVKRVQETIYNNEQTRKIKFVHKNASLLVPHKIPYNLLDVANPSFALLAVPLTLLAFSAPTNISFFSFSVAHLL